MSLIEKYKEKKRQHAAAKAYFDVFDQPGHMNERGKLVKVKLNNFTVYHQAYAGANNYHEADQWLKDEIDAVLVDLGWTIRKNVMLKLEARMVAAAQEAKKEAEAVIAAATEVAV